MHLYNKDDFEYFFKEPTKDKLTKLLKTHTGENNHLEFKEKWIEVDKLAKIVISIINSGGGVIIFGIKEHKKEKTFENFGLLKEDIQDKTEMMKKLNSYINNRFYDIRNFDYTDAAYGELQGKFFQMIIIQSDISELPLFSLKESEHIKKNEIYIRRGASTEIANNEELQLLLENTIKARINNFISGDINEELMQLKVLYSFQKNNNEYNRWLNPINHISGIGYVFMSNETFMYRNIEKTDKFQIELNELVQQKLIRIKKLLHLDF